MFGMVIVVEQSAGGARRSEQLTQLRESRKFSQEVVFLLISKMPAVFQKVPYESVVETSEQWFLHLVCQLDMGLTQYLFLNPLKILLCHTYVCVMEPLEYTSIKRNTMVMPVFTAVSVIGSVLSYFLRPQQDLELDSSVIWMSF